MNKIDLIPRIVENKDWATVLFVIALIMIAITRSSFENRFNDFTNLIFSDKYLKIYKDGSNLMTWFTTLLFVVQLISLSFFVQLVLSYLGYTTKTNYISFIQIFTIITFFILSKFLIEKIIGVAFNIENLIEQFNLFKVSYRTYFSLLLLIINIVLFYTNILNYYAIISLAVILLIINVVTYLLSLKNYQKLLLSKLFYFILYICALEIAPYYFVYYFVIKQ
jgi:Domain of unknown function (DUF4271)